MLLSCHDLLQVRISLKLSYRAWNVAGPSGTCLPCAPVALSPLCPCLSTFYLPLLAFGPLLSPRACSSLLLDCSLVCLFDCVFLPPAHPPARFVRLSSLPPVIPALPDTARTLALAGPKPEVSLPLYIAAPFRGGKECMRSAQVGCRGRHQAWRGGGPVYSPKGHFHAALEGYCVIPRKKTGRCVGSGYTQGADLAT